MAESDRQRVLAAADALIAARRDGRIADLPAGCRPRSVSEAYAIQDTVVTRLGGIAGWKVGASAADATPGCAPLPNSSILPSPAAAVGSDFTMRGVEAEIAFRLSRDLPVRDQPYDRDDILAAIEVACPALELCESRYTDFTSIDPLCHLADSNANQALVVGDDWSDWPSLDVAAQPVTLSIGGQQVADQHGGNAAGEPIRLLVWLANHAADRGAGLRRGQIVTTGSWTGLRFARPGDRVVARFANIGSVEASFSA